VREVIVWPTVHNILWQNLDRESYDSLCARLVFCLEKKYTRLRNDRHPDDETLFVCVIYLVDGNKWHRFEFHVDDTMADTCLFVLNVVHEVSEIE
jgi:hypothetical protein